MKWYVQLVIRATKKNNKTKKGDGSAGAGRGGHNLKQGQKGVRGTHWAADRTASLEMSSFKGYANV